ncbi:MAG: flagellar assembly protein FliW [Nitrospinales bacterium]
MKYHSTRLGDFDLQKNEVLRFAGGLYGFEQEKRFAVLPFNREIESPLEWMQSLQNPDLAFVITDPHLFIADYKVSFLDHEKADIELQPDEPCLVRVIVNIPSVYTEMTANLVAPIAINSAKNLAKQFILTTSEYDTRHYLFSDEVRKSASSDAQ